MGMGTPAKKSDRVVMSEINVTPFVDVMLVLLIIFMVTAPMMKQGLEVELPETEASGVSTADEPLTIVIKRNRAVYIGEATVRMSELQKRLSAIFSTRKNKQVYLQADKYVEYGVVAEVMAEVRAAGIFNIGLLTIPRGSK